MSTESTQVRLNNGGIVKALIVKRCAKTTQVRIPVLLCGVLTWDYLRVPNDRVDVDGNARNVETFNVATVPGKLYAHTQAYLKGC